MVRDMCKKVNRNLYVAWGLSVSASVSNARYLCVVFNMVIKA